MDNLKDLFFLRFSLFFVLSLVSLRSLRTGLLDSTMPGHRQEWRRDGKFDRGPFLLSPFL